MTIVKYKALRMTAFEGGRVFYFNTLKKFFEAAEYHPTDKSKNEISHSQANIEISRQVEQGVRKESFKVVEVE